MSHALNFEQFKERFKPMHNHLNPLAELGGLMFHPSQIEMAYVHQQDASAVWTVHQINGVRVIASTFSQVDREGYLIATVAVEPGAFYEVLEDDDDDPDIGE